MNKQSTGFVVQDEDGTFVLTPGYYTKNILRAKMWATESAAQQHVDKSPANLSVQPVTVTLG